MRIATVVRLAALLLTISGAALAEDGPIFAPTRDLTVTYQLSGDSKMDRAPKIKVTYGDHNERVRLDLFAFPKADRPFASIIYDHPADRVLTLIYAKHAYLKRDTNSLVNPGIMLNEKMHYTRLGTDTVANLPCTDWQLSGDNGNAGTACITDDGVALRAIRTEPRPGSMTALAVAYGPPPDDAFSLPASFTPLR